MESENVGSTQGTLRDCSERLDADLHGTGTGIIDLWSTRD